MARHLAHLLPNAGSCLAAIMRRSTMSRSLRFMAALRERESMAALALEFCILTATRTT